MVDILFAGDFSPFNKLQNSINSSDINGLFGDFLTTIQNSDFAIVNFESNIQTSLAKPIEKSGIHISCPENSIKFLKDAGFDLLTLANNHFFDYGDEGVDSTLISCKKNDIDFVGGGMDINEAKKIYYTTIKEEIFAFINVCEHEFSIATESKGGSNPLNPIQQFYEIKEARTKADYVIIIVHGGHEHYQLPSPRMKETYRFFVDVGADLVINHHQHCYSGYEIYKQKPIIYGLGNFLFDSPYKEDNNFWEGYMVKIKFDKSKLECSLIPYNQCKSNIGLTKLTSKEKELFDQKIHLLNNIISNDQELLHEFDKRLEQTRQSYLYTFEPSKPSLLMRVIFKFNLVSTFISKEKRKLIYNRIVCESHRDSIVTILKKEIN